MNSGHTECHPKEGTVLVHMHHSDQMFILQADIALESICLSDIMLHDACL